MRQIVPKVRRITHHLTSRAPFTLGGVAIQSRGGRTTSAARTGQPGPQEAKWLSQRGLWGVSGGWRKGRRERDEGDPLPHVGTLFASDTSLHLCLPPPITPSISSSPYVSLRPPPLSPYALHACCMPSPADTLMPVSVISLYRILSLRCFLPPPPQGVWGFVGLPPARQRLTHRLRFRRLTCARVCRILRPWALRQVMPSTPAGGLHGRTEDRTDEGGGDGCRIGV